MVHGRAWWSPFLWWDAMVTLNARDKDLVLPQLNVPDLVDSLWKTLLFGSSGWGWVVWEARGPGGGKGGIAVVGM